MRAGLPDRRADAGHRWSTTPSSGDSADYDSEVESVCPFCGVGCQVDLKVKDGRVKYVEGIDGPANENRLCVKGRFGFDYIHHPHRLTKPLIRREDAPAKGLNVDPINPLDPFPRGELGRGAGAPRRAGDPRRRHGAKCGGRLRFGQMLQRRGLPVPEADPQGFGHNNVDHCTRLCHASSVAALMENVGSGAVTATFNEIENADVPSSSAPTRPRTTPSPRPIFKQFAKRGGKLIVMDPRGRGDEAHATHMLQFKPGADVALLNAIMHVIVEEKLYDQQYIDAFTENFEAEKEHPPFTPEKMEPICGIDCRDDPRPWRGLRTAKAAMIFWGMGVSASTSTAPTMPAA
jgi:formate dehydrogenase major subunit